MEPADIFKINMSVEEARAQMEQLPEGHRARNIPLNAITPILVYRLTPAQAQAALVLAWNEVLSITRCGYPPEADN